jgi:hypothetical protein
MTLKIDSAPNTCLAEARRVAGEIRDHGERLAGLIHDQVEAQDRGEQPLVVSAQARLLLALLEHARQLENLADELTIDVFEARRPLDGRASADPRKSR